jgi:hypothetical protein
MTKLQRLIKCFLLQNELRLKIYPKNKEEADSKHVKFMPDVTTLGKGWQTNALVPTARASSCLPFTQ